MSNKTIFFWFSVALGSTYRCQHEPGAFLWSSRLEWSLDLSLGTSVTFLKLQISIYCNANFWLMQVYWAAPIVASLLTTTTYKGIFGFGRAPDDEDADGQELEELGRPRNPVVLNSAWKGSPQYQSFVFSEEITSSRTIYILTFQDIPTSSESSYIIYFWLGNSLCVEIYQ